jgi:ATP-binding cassette subfamily B protein/subfamily B ATP-binding cassette protein MsbA
LAQLAPRAAFAMLVAAAVLSQALRSALTSLGTSAVVQVGWNTYGLVQRRVFAQIMAMSFGTATRRNSGDLADVVVSPAKAVTELVNVFSDLLTTSLTALVYLGLLLKLSVPLMLASLAVFGAAVGAQRGLVRRVRRAGIEQSEAGALLMQRIVEKVQALRLIHTFQRQAAATREIDGSIAAVTLRWRTVYRIMAILQPLGQTITVAAVGSFLIIGVFVLHGGQSALPQLLTFTVLVNRLATRVGTLPATAGDVARQIGQLGRLAEILDLRDKELLSDQGEPYPGLQSVIEFRNVSLRYRDADADAVQGLSFAIPRGKVTALVGSSGAGKSTIADLLLRLYEPSDGAIVADGKAINGYSLSSWRDRLGVVSQDTMLFSTTVRENIRFGRAEASNADVEAAARLANADDFITALPDGYDTLVGEGGHGLSGGQRQRLALARAVIRHPEILVLDEATSALDSASEQLIQQALEAFSRDRTVVVIAHRLGTISRADQILLVEEGRIVESGNHQELLDRDGLYARYWRLQSASPLDS